MHIGKEPVQSVQMGQQDISKVTLRNDRAQLVQSLI